MHACNGSAPRPTKQIKCSKHLNEQTYGFISKGSSCANVSDNSRNAGWALRL